MDIRNDKSEFEQIKKTIILWLKHWYYFVISMAICLTLAIVYVKIKIPVMKVMAQVAIRQDESLSGAPSVSRNQSILSAFGFGRSSQNIEDETLKMNSQGYIKKIVKKYSLNFDYKQSEFWGLNKTKLYDTSPVILSIDEAISDTINSVVFKIDLEEDRITVKMKQKFRTLGEYEITNLPSSMETPLGTFIISKSEYYDMYKKPMKINVWCTNYDYMTQIYQKSIKVDFEKKTSDLLQLSMDTENPLLAKKVLNEMIANYNAEWVGDRDLVTKKTLAVIEDKLDLVKDELLQADKAIQLFKDQYNLTEVEADVKYYLTLNGELQPALIEAESKLKMIDIIVDYVNDEKSKYSLFPLNTNLAIPSIAEVIFNYNEALSKRNEMNKTATQSSIVKSINSQVEAQREVLLKSVNNVKKDLQIAVSDLKKKESEIKNKIGKIPEIEKSYVKLRRDQEIQQTIYIYLLEMREQTEVKGVSLLPKLKVIDEPYVVNKQIEPSLIKVAINTLFFGGILLPLSAIYGFPLINNNIRKRKEK